MRIKEISVTGLFGVFDRVIPLNIDERITIIHAPNGFGKTIIFKILYGLFNSKYSIFWDIPFNVFRVNLSDGFCIEIIKKFEYVPDDFFPEQEMRIEKINVNLYNSKMKLMERWNLSKPSISSTSPQLPRSGNQLEKTLPYVIRVTSNKWQDIATGEILSVEEVINRFWNFFPSEIPSIPEPQWFIDIKKVIHVHLIESQRLLNTSTMRDFSILPTISDCSKELASHIQSKLTEYGKVSQSLDRTFPVRVIKEKPSPSIANEKLLQQLTELENNRFRLIEVGLLDEDENPDFEILSHVLDDSTKRTLSIYIEDVKAKFHVFDDIANKIDFLKKIINKKFRCSHKKMIIDKKKGFIFTIPYESDLSGETYLQPKDLSSGEQHEIVLLYELLFKVKPNTLVLIDEPEISLHVGWQVDFLKDLQEITKLVDIDILIATHSPDIIHDRWDLTVELKGVKA